MSALATFVGEWHHEVPVARLEGEIDISNVDDLGSRLRGLLSNRSFALVVDLSQTTYLDSAGINLLFAVGDEMRARQQDLHLVVARASPVERMISLTGLDTALSTHADLRDAVAHASGQQETNGLG